METLAYVLIVMKLPVPDCLDCEYCHEAQRDALIESETLPLKNRKPPYPKCDERLLIGHLRSG